MGHAGVGAEGDQAGAMVLEVQAIEELLGRFDRALELAVAVAVATATRLAILTGFIRSCARD